MSAEFIGGRTLAMFGDASASRRVLVVGCVNGRRCGGTDVTHAAMIGCPPPDVELWYLHTLDPRGADLDRLPAHPGAEAFRQAVADLRPTAGTRFATGADQDRRRMIATGATPRAEN